MQIYLCDKTGKIYGGESGIYTLGYHDYLTDEEHQEISNWRTRNVEKNRFEKAKKIKWSDWKGEQFHSSSLGGVLPGYRTPPSVNSVPTRAIPLEPVSSDSPEFLVGAGLDIRECFGPDFALGHLLFCLC